MSSVVLAPVPPAELLEQLLPEELQQHVEAWLMLVRYHIALEDTSFQERGESISTFLVSYFSVLSSPSSPGLQHLLRLKQQVFVLSHRILSVGEVPKQLLRWEFLSDFCRQYSHSRSLQELLSSVWRRNEAAIVDSLESTKRSFITVSPSDHDRAAMLNDFLTRVAPLIQILPNVGGVILAGSDFLDTLMDVFPNASDQLKKSAAITLYLSLIALVAKTYHNVSQLHDQLYVLKADGDKRGHASLIAAVVSDTPLLSKLAASPALQDSKRTLDLSTSLRDLRHTTNHGRPRKVNRPKGKRRAVQEFGHDFGSVHMHRMSLITQVQDLFPDLGTAFIAKLLSEYDDDIERASLHLLEDSLPKHLQTADRTEQLPETSGVDHHQDILPAATPPSERRNVFDDDAFDRLTVEASRLHIGKKEVDDGEAPNKAAILSALAAFDSDDDERDDTYDVEDVGGTVDTANPEADSVGVDDQREEILFRAYKLDPKVFERDAATRRGKPRAALRNETSLTDEAIEGWLVVNARDPRKMRRLEAKFSTWTGQQLDLASTAWRHSPRGSGAEEDSDDGSTVARGGRGRGPRGRGGFRGRGGNVGGPPGEKDTQQARQRKEAGKSSRANHNRRDQRAKKMARGGYRGDMG